MAYRIFLTEVGFLYLLFILRKGEFPFPVPFTKIVDATELQIITRAS